MVSPGGLSLRKLGPGSLTWTVNPWQNEHPLRSYPLVAAASPPKAELITHMLSLDVHCTQRCGRFPCCNVRHPLLEVT